MMGALVLAVTQLFKITLNISKRYIPITSVLTAVILFSLYAYFNHLGFTWEILTQGLIAGLTASGLWSGLKTTLK